MQCRDVPRTAIETREDQAYLRSVALAHLIRFLTILALALSPLAALGTAPASAMSHHAAMSADAPSGQIAGHQMAGHQMAGDAAMATMSHCKDMDGKSKDEPCRSADCLVTCAAIPAIAAVGGALEPHALVHGLLQQPALASVPHGLVPEAATPPPRGLLKI